MKKILSGILALSMMFSGLVFNVANAAEIDSKYVTATDNTPGNQYKVFLSEGQAPSAMGEYDWFYLNDIAMDLSYMKSGVRDGYWRTEDGVPYDVDLTDNGAGTDLWDNAYLTEDYYSEIKLLIAKVDNLGNNDDISYSVNSASVDNIQAGNSGDWGENNPVLLDNNVKLWKVAENNVVETTEQKGELWEYTIELNDNTKATKINRVYHAGIADDADIYDNIVLGVTGVKMTADDWKALIGRKLAAFDTKPDDAVLADITDIMKKAETEGLDLNTVEGYDKYIGWTTEPEYTAATYAADASRYKAFLSENAERASDGIYDWFMRDVAIDKNKMPGNLNAEGYWVGSSGVPYKFEIADNAAGVDFWSTAFLPEDYYSKVKVLVAVADVSDKTYGFGYSIDNGKQQDYGYSYETYSQKIIETVPALDVSNGTAVANGKQVELVEYTINLTNAMKATKISKVYHQGSGGSEAEYDNIVLAVTGVGLVGTEWKGAIEAELAEYETKPDDTALAEITAMIEKAAEKGFVATEENVLGYDKYLEWTNKTQYVPEYTVATYKDGVNRYKAFLSEGGSADLSGSPFDWFRFNDMAIDTTKIQLNEEGYWVGSSGVPYKFEIGNNATGVDLWTSAFLPEGYYSKVKVLVAVADVSDKTYGFGYSIENGLQENYNYDSNAENKEIVGIVPALDVSNGTAVANDKQVELVEYTIDLTDAMKATKISQVYHRGNNDTEEEYDNIALAVTGVGLTGTEWIPAIEAEIADVTGTPTVEKFREIKTMIDKAESNGVLTDSIVGIDRYREWESMFGAWETADEIVLNVNPNGTEGDIKTLAEAKEMVRQLKAEYSGKPIRVKFHEGVYRFEQSVVFDGDDSGSETAPVIYEAAEGANVEFKGSKEITAELNPITDDEIKNRLKPEIADNVKEIDLTKSGITQIEKFVANGPHDTGSEPAWVYLNGVEQPVAQFPDGDGSYSRWDEIVAAGDVGLTSTNGGTIKVKEDISHWKNAEEAYLGGYFGYDYRYERIGVKEIDPTAKTITLATGTDLGLINESSKRWKIFNIPEEIDVPGEWYIDRENLKLYYYAPDNADNGKLELSLMSDSFISFEGAENIIIRNINFSQNRGYGIYLGTNTKNIKIEGCAFEDIQRAAVKLGGSTTGSFEAHYNYIDAASYVTIKDCDFYNIGAQAIYTVGGGNRETLTSSGIVIANNHINKVAQKAKNKAAVAIEGGIGFTVENNLIHNTPFHAINFFGNGHKINKNEIENVCREVTDAGAIYSGRSYIMRGNEVTNNYIHDYRTKDEAVQREDTSAIYLDDMMSGVKVSGNIIVNGLVGIHLNGGVDNTVEDNILLGLDRVFYTSNVGESQDEAIVTARKVLVNDVKTVLEIPVWEETYHELEKLTATTGGEFGKGFEGAPENNTIQNNISDRKAEVHERFIKRGEVTDNTITTKGLTEVLADKGISLSGIGLQRGIDIDNTFKKYYPANNAVSVNPYSCRFSWQQTKGADKYKLIIAKDASLTDIVYEEICDSNYCDVKDLDAGVKTYYWQVQAISDADSPAWYADSVYSFETTAAKWIYESDSKPSKTIDLSEKVNEKVFLEAGTQYGGTAGNKATLASIYEKNRESLNIDGIVYKLANLDGSFDTVKIGNKKVEIPFNDENCEMISFLASGVNGEEKNYPVKIYYTDGTNDSATFNIGGFNERTGTYAFKTGTITADGKAENAGGYIYQFTMQADPAKQIEKVEFGEWRLFGSSEVRIYAVTGVLPEVVSTGTGVEYNIMLNGSCSNTIKKIFTQVGEGNKLIDAKTESITTNGTMKENLVKVELTKVDANSTEMNLYLWSGLESMKPNSLKITRTITK